MIEREKFGLRISAEVERVPKEVIEKLKEYDTGLLCDGMLNSGAMHSCIKPLIPGKVIVGTAITVKLPIGDSMVISKAMDIAQEGDIVVVDAHGTTDNAVIGDIKYLTCKLKGIAGIVVDGAVRDIKGMREFEFPVFAKALTCRSSSKNNPGEINIPISCGGITVRPGDIIFADDEGVVVVPPEYLDEIIENVEKKKVVATRMRQEAREGQYVTGKFIEQMKKYGYKD